jgi:hypothetical protein
VDLGIKLSKRLSLLSCGQALTEAEIKELNELIEPRVNRRSKFT